MLAVLGGNLCQLDLSTRINCYRCSLPGLAGFTIYRCKGTDTDHHNTCTAQLNLFAASTLPSFLGQRAILACEIP